MLAGYKYPKCPHAGLFDNLACFNCKKTNWHWIGKRRALMIFYAVIARQVKMDTALTVTQESPQSSSETSIRVPQNSANLPLLLF